MALLLDTANISDAHACGYDREHGINSDDRLVIHAEHGGLSIMRGGHTEQLSGEELEALLDALRAYQAKARAEAFVRAA